MGSVVSLRCLILLSGLEKWSVTYPCSAGGVVGKLAALRVYCTAVEKHCIFSCLNCNSLRIGKGVLSYLFLIIVYIWIIATVKVTVFSLRSLLNFLMDRQDCGLLNMHIPAYRIKVNLWIWKKSLESFPEAVQIVVLSFRLMINTGFI